MQFFRQRQAQIQREPEDDLEESQNILNKMWSEIPAVQKEEPFEINAQNANEVAEQLGLKAPNTCVHKEKSGETNEKRLSRSLADLPIPAAFRDAMDSLRELRDERNSQDDTELKQIYQLAVWQSFCVKPYSKIAQCPTFEILNEAFEEVKNLPYSWEEFGYEKLNLEPYDIEAMVSFWGKPKSHKTLNQVYKQLYKETELKLKETLY